MLTPVAQSFAAAQAVMMEHFEASMMGMVRQFGELHREQLVAMQGELARMAELNVELQRLQAQPPDAEATGPRVGERLSELQAERQSLWQRLFATIAPPPVA